MNTNGTDNKFHQLFGELKSHDEQTAPAFGRLTRPASPVRSMPWPWLLPSAAAAALLVVGLSAGLFYARSHRLAFEEQQWAALSNWQASTDVLLTSAESSSASAVPDGNATNPQGIP